MRNVKIDSISIGECWLKSIERVLAHGDHHQDEDIEILELQGMAVEISNPDPDDELVHQLGDPKVIFGTFDKFTNGIEMPHKPFTYSQRIYNNNGVNQFKWMTNRLLNKAETKSATFCLLLPGDNSQNIPCLTTIDAKIRAGFLHLHFFYRSQNIYGRQYANLLALARFQRELAETVSVTPGKMQGYIASAHIYEFDFDHARRLVNGNSECISDQYYIKGPKSIRVG